MLKYCLLLLLALPLASRAEVFSHDDWGKVLDRFVDDNGMVDYLGLAEDRELFDQYLERIKRTGPRTHPERFPNRDHELAYYMNAYNALVFEGVLARGPEEKSVWRGFISGLNFFILMDVTLEGRETNLKKLEDDIIRAEYQDPRIHAAINCASISCPRLPQEPFYGGMLQEQLDAAIKEFVNSPQHVRIDGDAVYLSKIFDWFEEDFVAQNRSLVDYVNQYRQEKISPDLSVKYLPYNKGINHQR